MIYDLRNAITPTSMYKRKSGLLQHIKVTYVAWVLKRYKLPATRWFVQQLGQDNIKETPKLNISDRWPSRTKGQQYGKSYYAHDVIMI